MTSSDPKRPPLALLLAEKILRPELAMTTPRADAWVKAAIADTVGCILAGVNEPPARILLATDGIGTASGNSLIFGTNIRTSALDAALVNGTAAHALDYDDMLNIAVAHPSAVILPAIFAVGEKIDASGRDLMTAYVAGLELGVRVALAVLPQHRDNGWHPTATIGLFCALGAAARLMNLSAEQTARAIGIAVSEAAGVSANFGTMTKPFHAGRAARSAVLAAQLAANGFSGNPGAFEHPAGFFNVFVRGAEPNVEAMLSDFGSPLELANIGVALKPYPCCGLTHSAADLMLALRREHNLSPDQVKQIEIYLHPKSIGGVDRPAPATGLDAAFSTQYVVARALTDGVLRIDHFQDAATREPRIREVLTKITMRPNSHVDPKIALIFSSELVIHTVDGKRIARYADEPNYRDLDNPLNDAELWEKFSDCARRGIPAEAVKSLFDLLMRLEAQPSLQAISEKLAFDRPRSAVAAE